MKWETKRFAGACTAAVLALGSALLLGVTTPAWSQEPAVDVRVVTDEADAVLALFAKRARGAEIVQADWQQLFTSEGYRRLKQRSESYGAQEFDEKFSDWVLTADLADRELLRTAVERWRHLNATAAGRAALAYLPEGTRIRAKIYAVLKQTSNSFVFELDTDPAIFMYVSGRASEAKLANTLAHELHHVGTVQACPESDEAPVSKAAGDVLRWMGAFAEGLAMLAAAGAPNVHPHVSSPAEEWIVWERDIAQFNRDLGRVEQFFVDIFSGELEAEGQPPRFFALINTEDVPQGAFYTVGWKMSALVEQSLGRQTVIDSVCDMRRLLVAYNSVAAGHTRGDAGSLALWSPEILEKIGASGSASSQ